jgi:hypothetical protein
MTPDELLRDAPLGVRQLPRDVRGYPVPWFVQWFGDKPDFRFIAKGKFNRALAGRHCWICGERLGRYMAFVIGPMCLINRISSEPPSHRECAEYAATHCPFLINPKMHRQDHNLPAHQAAPGIMFEENPGVCVVMTTREMQVSHLSSGPIIDIGEPTDVVWYREGRLATRDEALDAFKAGAARLAGLCKSADDHDELTDDTERAMHWLPSGENRHDERSAD